MAFIVGTAGHIDHGKTTLVRSLTGVDLDSAPEEKERGITISLGFTSMQLDDSEISFVDVPGHERLIRTMIAGATGLDAVLLCISATDSVMPQTQEHLNILDLLGIEQGLIAITMCDLADEEDIELITEEIFELVEGTFLEGAPIIQTSSEIPFGQEEIKKHLQQMQTNTTKVLQQMPFRLPVDRVFTQKGFGTVVTGTARGIPLSNGSSGNIVQILPENKTAKIRSIQQHGRSVEVAENGRVALNLSGVSVDDLSRGSVIVVPNSIPTTQIIDIAYQHLEQATCLENGDRVRLLFGSSEALGKVYRIDAETGFDSQERGFLQVRLDSAQILCRDDRCILRRESPLETLGGGTVVDPYAPKIRQRNRQIQTAWLNRITHNDDIAFVERFQQRGRTLQECQLLGLDLDGSFSLGKQVYSPTIIDKFITTINETLTQFHTNHPLKIGATRMELTPALPFLNKENFQDLIQQMLERQDIQEKNGRLHHPNFTVQLTSAQRQEIDKRLQILSSKHLEGQPLAELTDLSKSLLHYLFETTQIVRVGNQVLHPQLVNQLLRQIRQHFEHNSTLNTSEFKEMTQLSRKFSIPLLEWMDENQKTRRNGDVRIAGGTLSKDI